MPKLRSLDEPRRPRDCSIEECAELVAPYVARGAIFYQKFTCAGCGARQTMSEKNMFFETGGCEECGHVTDIRKKCGVALVLNLGTSGKPEENEK